MSTCKDFSTALGCWNKADGSTETVVIHYTYANDASGNEIIKATRYTDSEGAVLTIPAADQVAAGACAIDVEQDKCCYEVETVTISADTVGGPTQGPSASIVEAPTQATPDEIFLDSYTYNGTTYPVSPLLYLQTTPDAPDFAAFSQQFKTIFESDTGETLPPLTDWGYLSVFGDENIFIVEGAGSADLSLLTSMNFQSVAFGTIAPPLQTVDNARVEGTYPIFIGNPLLVDASSGSAMSVVTYNNGDEIDRKILDLNGNEIANATLVPCEQEAGSVPKQVEMLVDITGGASDENCVVVIACIETGQPNTYTRLDGVLIEAPEVVTPVTDPDDCCVEPVDPPVGGIVFDTPQRTPIPTPPVGATALRFYVYGAGGAGSYRNYPNYTDYKGGDGGYVSGEIAVSYLTSYPSPELVVGSGGQVGSVGGAFGGGGDAQYGYTYPSGSGGGYSGLALGPVGTYGFPIAIAGGGGGASADPVYATSLPNDRAGGDGGALPQSAASTPQGGYSASVGTGGTGGVSTVNGQNGASYSGGNSSIYGGGGGGGGYFGGGGGAYNDSDGAFGGGGGINYIDAGSPYITVINNQSVGGGSLGGMSPAPAGEDGKIRLVWIY